MRLLLGLQALDILTPEVIAARPFQQRVGLLFFDGLDHVRSDQARQGWYNGTDDREV